MEFSEFNSALQANINELFLHLGRAYIADVDKDQLWEMYLSSFPEGSNPIYRTRTEHDCSCCRQFIKNFGAMVFLDANMNTVSIWNMPPMNSPYDGVAAALRDFVQKAPIKHQALNYDRNLGTERTPAKAGDSVIMWDHFHYKVATDSLFEVERRVNYSQNIGRTTQNKETFKRALDTLTRESALEVLELIEQGSLYRGETYQTVLQKFLRVQEDYFNLQEATEDSLRPVVADNFCWKHSMDKDNFPVVVLRNSAVGTLLQDLSGDMGMEEAVRRYEAITAPQNYRRPKALVTKATLQKARETLQSLDLEDSLPRRYARIEDISVGNVLFADADAAPRMQGSALDALEEEVNRRPPSMSRVEEISWDKFVSDVLPKATSLEVLLETRLKKNMVSLLAPVNPDAKRIFSWDNGFCWAYEGNVADSMKERVKAAGGKVDGDLRFSIQWNEDGRNQDDMDAHCFCPNKEHIYYSTASGHSCGGTLDVDIIHPLPDTAAVENIIWPSRARMPDGKYEMFVSQFSARGGRGGFRAEIEFDGQIHEFDCPEVLQRRTNIATVTKKGGVFTIEPALDSKHKASPGREIWGVQSNQFLKVSAAMFSPNYWDQQKGTGHRHLFFMLEGCTREDAPNAFYNEFLRAELNPHRRVFELLGSRMSVEEDPRQLSGLGFSTSAREEVTVRVKGAFERVLKVKF